MAFVTGQLFASLLFSLAVCVSLVFGHVRLTFPPARYPDLDFLDTARTQPPCGIPKPAPNKGIYTTIESGSRLNVTWFMAYAHRGGFRIEILNENDTPIFVLTPESEQWAGLGDQTQQSYEIDLPAEFECKNCAIRLMRQAIEWGHSYIFWSCADVNIVKRQLENRCSGHGTHTEIGCLCEKLYSGQFCQYKDECWNDEDCGRGRCQNLETDNFPQRVCFCEAGYFGTGCSQVSSLKEKKFDTTAYKMQTVGAHGKMFWRIDDRAQEIEMVLQYPTQSWVAIGWRSAKISPTCAKLPTLYDPSAPHVEPEPNAVPEGHPQPKPEPAPVWTPNGSFLLAGQEGSTSPEPNNATSIGGWQWNISRVAPGPASGFNFSHFPGPNASQPREVEPTEFAWTWPAAATPAGPTGTTEASVIFWQPHANGSWTVVNHTGSTSGIQGFTRPAPNPSPNLGPFVQTRGPFIIQQPQPGPQLGPQPNQTQFEIRPEFPEPGPRHPFPWTISSNNSNVNPFETPQPNWPFETPGNPPAGNHTLIEVIPQVFTPVPGQEFVNIPIQPQTQPAVRPFQRVESAIQAPGYDLSLVEFTDAIHLATTKPPLISQVTGDDCYGEWRWPPGCIGGTGSFSQQSCEYRAVWTYIEETDEIEFSIETRGPSNWWSGIGFSKTGTMSDADVILVTWERGGEIEVIDAYTTGHTPPVKDRQQDVRSHGGSHVNGVLRVGFSRPRKSDDISHDVSFNDNDCFYFLFPVTGGRLENGKVTQHIDTPANSTVPVCLRQCKITPPPVRKECQAEFKFPSGCVPPACDYFAKWKFNPQGEDVQFEITSKEIGRWTGIGFSRDQNMTNSDIVLGWVYNEQAMITDRFAYGKHSPPIDQHQDIHGISAKVTDTGQTIIFRRKLLTEDSREDLPLIECLYFLFPVGGGRVFANSPEQWLNKATAIGYHDYYIPRASPVPICICTEDGQPILSRKRRQLNANVTDTGLGTNTSHLEREPHDHNTLHAEPHAEPEAHGKAHPEPVPEGEATAKEALHAMDCVDMVIGMAVGNLHRIGDYYSISRATPRQDSFYNGTDSLVAAYGYEEDGITTIMFKKPLTASDKADNSFEKGPMHVVWAWGQDPINYLHDPPSALEASPVGKPETFYANDVLRYHGIVNRGVLSLNFFEQDQPTQDCGQGEYRIDHYFVSWKRQGEDVHFMMEVDARINTWTGIGFSKQGKMTDADMIIAQVLSDGQVLVMDRHAKGYGPPPIDSDQNIFNIDWQHLDGKLQLRFTRPLVTTDATEDADLTQCITFLYPFSGGPLGADGDITKHDQTPIVSQPICLIACNINATSTTGASGSTPETSGTSTETRPPLITKKPTTLQPQAIPQNLPSKYYAAQLVLKEEWKEAYKQPNSVEYAYLKGLVESSLHDFLSVNLKGFRSVRVRKFEPGSVVADVEVETEDQVTKEQVESVLKAGASNLQNQIGGIFVDPQRITVQKSEGPKSSGDQSEWLRNWIIIGVACFLVLIAVIFGIILCVRARVKRSKKSYRLQTSKIPYVTPPYIFGMMEAQAHGYGAFPPGYPPQGMVPPPLQMQEKPMSSASAAGEENPQNAHARQYSQATTASANGGGNKTPSPKDRDSATENGNGSKRPPSETSFGEWYQRVNTADDSEQKSDDSKPSPPPSRPPAFTPAGTPYVTYPGDPYSYYTLGGQTRMPAAPTPRGPYGYYRPF